MGKSSALNPHLLLAGEILCHVEECHVGIFLMDLIQLPLLAEINGSPLKGSIIVGSWVIGFVWWVVGIFNGKDTNPLGSFFLLLVGLGVLTLIVAQA